MSTHSQCHLLRSSSPRSITMSAGTQSVGLLCSAGTTVSAAAAAAAAVTAAAAAASTEAAAANAAGTSVVHTVGSATPLATDKPSTTGMTRPRIKGKHAAALQLRTPKYTAIVNSDFVREFDLSPGYMQLQTLVNGASLPQYPPCQVLLVGSRYYKSLRINCKEICKPLTLEGMLLQGWSMREDGSLVMVMGNDTKRVLPTGCKKKAVQTLKKEPAQSSEMPSRTATASLTRSERYELRNSAAGRTLLETRKRAPSLSPSDDSDSAGQQADPDSGDEAPTLVPAGRQTSLGGTAPAHSSPAASGQRAPAFHAHTPRAAPAPTHRTAGTGTGRAMAAISSLHAAPSDMHAPTTSARPPIIARCLFSPGHPHAAPRQQAGLSELRVSDAQVLLARGLDADMAKPRMLQKLQPGATHTGPTPGLPPQPETSLAASQERVLQKLIAQPSPKAIVPGPTASVAAQVVTAAVAAVAAADEVEEEEEGDDNESWDEQCESQSCGQVQKTSVVWCSSSVVSVNPGGPMQPLPVLRLEDGANTQHAMLTKAYMGMSRDLPLSREDKHAVCKKFASIKGEGMSTFLASTYPALCEKCLVNDRAGMRAILRNLIKTTQ